MIQNPDFCGPVDSLIHLFRTPLKIATLLLIPFALRRVAGRCAGAPRQALVAGSAWLIGAWLLLGACTFFRSHMDLYLGDDTEFFYSTEPLSEGQWDPMAIVPWPQFFARWESGQITLIEALCLLASVAGTSFIFFRWGRKPVSAAVAATWIGTVTLSFGFGGRLFVFDYDNYYAGSLVGPLACDLFIPPTSSDLATGIGYLAYLVLFGSTFILDVWILSAPLGRNYLDRAAAAKLFENPPD